MIDFAKSEKCRLLVFHAVMLKCVYSNIITLMPISERVCAMNLLWQYLAFGSTHIMVMLVSLAISNSCFVPALYSSVSVYFL